MGSMQSAVVDSDELGIYTQAGSFSNRRGDFLPLIQVSGGDSFAVSQPSIWSSSSKHKRSLHVLSGSAKGYGDIASGAILRSLSRGIASLYYRTVSPQPFGLNSADLITYSGRSR